MENPTCREESLGLNSDGHTDWVTGAPGHAEGERGGSHGCHAGRGGSPWGRLHCCVFWGTRGSRCAVQGHLARAPGSEPLPAWSGHRRGAPCCPLMPRPALWTQGAGP